MPTSAVELLAAQTLSRPHKKGANPAMNIGLAPQVCHEPWGGNEPVSVSWKLLPSRDRKIVASTDNQVPALDKLIYVNARSSAAEQATASLVDRSSLNRINPR